MGTKKSETQTIFENLSDKKVKETEELIRREVLLKTWVPTDLSDQEKVLAATLKKMSYPKNFPDEFKKEFALNVDSVKNHVDKSYEKCNNKKENINVCYESSYTPNGYRRRFF